MAKIKCAEHDIEMEPRTGYQTPEQKFCGQWFDCPKCTSSALIPSADLLAQLAAE